MEDLITTLLLDDNLDKEDLAEALLCLCYEIQEIKEAFEDLGTVLRNSPFN